MWVCKGCKRLYPVGLCMCPHCNNFQVKDFIKREREKEK